MARHQRERDGCLTCKQRKKKCDLGNPSCENCRRLNIPCGGYRQRLLWEDDPAREGMRRRGPTSSIRAYIYQKAGPHKRATRVSNVEVQELGVGGFVSNGDCVDFTSSISARVEQCQVSYGWQVPVAIPYLPCATSTNSSLERVLWDHYINCFARTYPTHSDEDNPFLSCLAPVAVQYEPVRWALMAIAGLHARSRNLPCLDREISRLRLRALGYCHRISRTTWRHDTSESNSEADTLTNSSFWFQLTNVKSDDLCLVTTAVCMAVFGKLSGEVYSNIRPYLNFAQDFLRHEGITPVNVELTKPPLYLFLQNLVSYNKLLALVADTGLTSKTNGSSGGTVSANALQPTRPNFADLLCRITDNAQDVSSLDIDRWDGNLDFLPSFTTKNKAVKRAGSAEICLIQESSSTVGGENRDKRDEDYIIGEIYRTSSRIHFFRQLRDRNGLSNTMATLAFPPFMAQKQIKRFSKLAIDHFRLLSDDSPFNTALLLPLGIIAPELTSKRDQTFVKEKLRMLEKTQCFDVFRVFSQDLQTRWSRGRSSQSAHLSTDFPDRPVRLIG